MAEVALEAGAVPSREELGRLLEAARITGPVATSRENNLLHYTQVAERNPRHLFGLRPRGEWTERDVLALMAERVGVDPDPERVTGADRIDTALTLDALDAAAARLARAGADRQRVLLGTGHPAGLLTVYLAVARGLAGAGATVLRPAPGWCCETFTRDGREVREIRYVAGVATVSDRGELKHSHSPRPPRAALAGLAEDGQPPPDLVVGDHGWAGAAGEAGVDVIGFADSNDPALFIGQAEGRLAIVVPLDDNVQPHLYEPMTAYLLAHAGLRG